MGYGAKVLGKDFLKIGFLLILSLMFVGIEAAECKERVYYSIHFASFKNLRNANKKVNAVKKKGKLVFWKDTNVPGKGRFYRLYLGKYENRTEASEFWKKLRKEGVVSYYGIHKFTETVAPIKVKEAVEPIKIEEPPATIASKKSKKDRAVGYYGMHEFKETVEPIKMAETVESKRIEEPPATVVPQTLDAVRTSHSLGS